MKPNGFVAAASITSQTLMLSFSQIMAISFTNPILTARNVFSKIFAISATREDETGITRSIAASYKALASSVQVFVMPPTILGVLRVL